MTIESTKMKSFLALSDIVSLLNMSSGFLSIICSINNQFGLASILMIAAIMFDSADGWVARKINRQDDLGFGKNIDSLSDVISFGVAPAIFVYQSINAPSDITQAAVILVSLFVVICGVLRLTRYNVIAGKIDTDDFIGIPIPTISYMLATFYLSGLYNTYASLALCVFVSLLMICNARYPKFDNKPIIAIAVFLIMLLIFQINIVVFNINIPALILLLFCLYYLIINLIKYSL